MSLISTTTLSIDKHPANKRSVVPEMMMMMMTFFVLMSCKHLTGNESKQTHLTDLFLYFKRARLKKFQSFRSADDNNAAKLFPDYFFMSLHYPGVVKELCSAMTVYKTSRATKAGLEFDT